MLDRVDLSSFVRHLVADVLLLPPGQNLVLYGLLGVVWMWCRGGRLRQWCGWGLVLNTLVLYALSAPWLAVGLVRWVEGLAPPPLPAVYLERKVLPADGDWHAVVVLTGGVRLQTPEYGNRPLPNDASAQRLHYAERLAQAQGLPLLIAGGGPFVAGGGVSEAAVLAQAVTRLPADRVWQEGVSVNTEAAPIEIQKRHPQVRQVLLVSDTTHLVRAVPLFERQGFVVLGAPTRYANVDADTAFAALPTAATLAESRRALHALWGWLAMHVPRL